ncbi:DUF2213 domain-containing protein [Brevibacillus ruminantium]|uniref:DUF2213 domain-containing protein n=1 Tax=Brevibacillus ruminantium TaxID=2950604 RepID=A0ABY4WDB7_9BACL|nr:DUF2213 domain-containing protein [Brevibacillus ruminantium]USG65172.1 DUF2213 domain-containing protein [Brevibacillus ruminantium]
MRTIRRAYYGSRFSKNMTATPEGFLICHNVPIARAGWYEYLGEEIGADDQRGKIVKVYRSPEDVFSPAAIASFEGKILTDEHPVEAVTPGNATRYSKGVVQNVRQGSGENSDLLLADLVVHDETLINEIQDGKREVSCGYECTYEPMNDGTYQQKDIRGNHVAVVKSGRAGDRVAIRDSKEERSMKKKITLPRKAQSRVTDLLAAIGLKQFAQDAEPEEIKDAVDALTEEKISQDEDEEKHEQKDENPAIQALAAQVQELKEMFAQLAKKEQEDEKPEDAIDQLISELEKKDIAEDEEEEAHTIPVESMMDEEGPVAPAEERPQSALDNAYKIAALKEIKPIIAAIPDPKQRKQATDAAIAAIRKGTGKNTYAAIQRGQRTVANDKKNAADSKQQDLSQLGKEWAKKFNPHYKDRA